MSSERLRGGLFTLVCEVAGCFLIAIGIYNFAVLSEFPMTGFSGIAIIVYRLTNIPIGLTIVALNIPVALLSYRMLGRRFFVHSLWCMLLSSFMIDYIAPLFPAYGGERLLSAVCCGVIAGIGYAIIYVQYASTGGSDFIVMAVKAKRPHISLGKIVFWSDVIVVVAGGVIFSDTDGIIYGLMINYLFAVVVDKLMYGINAGKLVLVVTDHSAAVTGAIGETTGRGATVWDARGGFEGDPRQLVMCACDNKQMYKVQRAVKACDPGSFLIVMESNEVHGEGFRPLVLGEKPEGK